jgi:Excreted virulence factor EspC, type VII ESX diderm
VLPPDVACLYIRSVGLLRVDASGLGVLAGRCESLASQLGGVAAPAPPGPSCQATSAAVDVLHTAVVMTNQALVGRMQATAAKLTVAGAAYSCRDSSSAADLHAVAETVTV